MGERDQQANGLVHGTNERGRYVQQNDVQDWQDSGFQERSSVEPDPQSLGRSDNRGLDAQGYVGSAWCAEGTLGQPSADPADHQHQAPGSWRRRAGEGSAVQIGGDGGRSARHQPTHDGPEGSRPFMNKGPRGYVRSDARIWEDVCDELSAGYLDASDVEVSVDQGVVRLNGFVTDQHALRRAQQMADGCRGVKGVENHLRVQSRDRQPSSD